MVGDVDLFEGQAPANTFNLDFFTEGHAFAFQSDAVQCGPMEDPHATLGVFDAVAKEEAGGERKDAVAEAAHGIHVAALHQRKAAGRNEIKLVLVEDFQEAWNLFRWVGAISIHGDEDIATGFSQSFEVGMAITLLLFSEDFCTKLSANISGSVGGIVVHDHNLIHQIRYLFQDKGKAFFFVVTGDDKGYAVALVQVGVSVVERAKYNQSAKTLAIISNIRASSAFHDQSDSDSGFW